MFFDVSRECVTWIAQLSSHAQPSFIKYEHANFKLVPQIRAVGETRNSLSSHYILMAARYVILVLRTDHQLTERLRTGATIDEGLPGGVLVPLFPSNIALCSHVPTNDHK